MLDLPTDLAQLRVLERFAELLLSEVRARITQVERQQAALRPVRALPQGPEWVLSYLRQNGLPVEDSVHRSDCRMASRHTRPLTRDDAVRALTTTRITACPICRPDTDLGLLD